MILPFHKDSLNRVLDIWLQASIKAHDFVNADYWHSQVDNMRNLYLPNSEVYCFYHEKNVLGFYALYEDQLAAIFVDPRYQGKGIGKQLLQHAKSQRESLSLSVYKSNKASHRFYQANDFTDETEQIDQHTGHVEIVMNYNKRKLG